MSRNKQRRFTNEFKTAVVRLTMTSGRSVERVANDPGIAKPALSRWRSGHGKSDFPEGPHEDVGKELTRLRKENENPSAGTRDPEEGRRFFRQGGKPMRFSFIDAKKAEFPAARLCETLEVSQSG